MPLTSAKIASVRNSSTNQKLADAHGLYLFVPAAKQAAESAKQPLTASWRYDYRYGGKRYTLTLGRFPLVGLAAARDLVNAARRELAAGTNPAATKRKEKLSQQADAAHTFEAVAHDWYTGKQERRSQSWRELNALFLRRDLAALGPLPVSQITKPLLIAALEISKRKSGIKTAERARQTAVQVLDYAVRKAKIEVNCARLLRGWEEIPRKVSHSKLPSSEIARFMDTADAYPGQLSTKLCIKLLMLTFVRKTELTEAEWSELDLENGLWSIAPERTKTKRAHVVPLSKQSIVTFKALKPMSFGSAYVFPSLSTIEKPMSRSTLNNAFKKMGYAATFKPHGVRATASTWLNEQGFRPDVIERQLAHVERNVVRGIYNQADYLSERAAMMQVWADFIDPAPEVSIAS